MNLQTQSKQRARMNDNFFEKKNLCYLQQIY